MHGTMSLKFCNQVKKVRALNSLGSMYILKQQAIIIFCITRYKK